jgi:hypothetical protein
VTRIEKWSVIREAFEAPPKKVSFTETHLLTPQAGFFTKGVVWQTGIKQRSYSGWFNCALAVVR